MNIARGAAAVQAQAMEFGITSADVDRAARGTAGYFSAMACEATAADLHIVLEVTGRGDGLAMSIARGAAAVQAQALEFGITSADVAQVVRGTAVYFLQAASAFAARGTPNPNMSTNSKNPDAARLGEEIVVEVMGRLKWEKYTTTSTKAMAAGDNPTPQKVSKNASAARPSREGWVFQHVTQTAER